MTCGRKEKKFPDRPQLPPLLSRSQSTEKRLIRRYNSGRRLKHTLHSSDVHSSTRTEDIFCSWRVEFQRNASRKNSHLRRCASPVDTVSSLHLVESADQIRRARSAPATCWTVGPRTKVTPGNPASRRTKVFVQHTAGTLKQGRCFFQRRK